MESDTGCQRMEADNAAMMAGRQDSKPLPSRGITLAAMMTGARLGAPVTLGLATYGLAYGLLARQAGLTAGEAMGMSGIVFAGASQFVALDFWGPVLPVVSIVITTLILNLRHVLMGAAIAQWLAGLTTLQRCLVLFFMVDESFAVTVAAPVRPADKASVLLGSGILIYVAWNVATLAGMFFLPSMPDPARYGLDFILVAAFVALLCALWRGPRDLWPWLTAAVAALAGSWALPGKWYILVGALAGGLVGALRNPDATEKKIS